MPVQIIELVQIMQRSANLSTYYKSFNKVQIIQFSSNHSTKYKTLNALYKSFNIVHIIQRIHIIQRCTNHSTL